MDFNELHEVVFDGGMRFRAADHAPVIDYRLVRNYRDVFEKKPSRGEALQIIRRKYESERDGHGFGTENAFWSDAHESGSAWQLSYGFGQAIFLDSPASHDRTSPQ